MIGVTAEDVIGENIAQLAEKGVIDQALTPHVIKARHPVTKLFYVLKTEKYIMSTGIPVFDEDGNIIKFEYRPTNSPYNILNSCGLSRFLIQRNATCSGLLPTANPNGLQLRL